MAVIKKDGNYTGLPIGFSRNNPIPLDKTAIWYSLDEAKTYAAGDPTAYVGQVLVVIDENNGSAAAYIITNIAGNLELIGSMPTQIADPQEGQTLFYNAESQSWINKNLTDDNSIIYLDDETQGLSIKGYKEALQGYMLVKDENSGLAWVKPLDETELRNAVSASEAAASQSSNYATQAGNSAIEADTSAKQADRINQQTMAWVNEKFWWGSLEEYNALETVNEGTFYFVSL